MDPFDRWSQQRLLEEVATAESARPDAAPRSSRPMNLTVIVILLFLLAVLISLATRDDATQQTSTPASTAPLELSDAG